MIWVRSIGFIVFFYIWSLTMALVMLPALLLPRRWMGRLFKVWGHGVTAGLSAICNIRVELRGRAFLPRGPALVAPKHQCMFDVFAQFIFLPDSCFVMKKELMWIPLLGWYALKMRMIVIDREGHSKTLRKMVREAIERFRDRRQMVIFPEGTRGVPGRTGGYKPGIAALYREFGVPCVPVATNSGVHWPAHGFLRRPGTIVFEFLDPIPPGMKRAPFMALLQERIETASLALLDE